MIIVGDEVYKYKKLILNKVKKVQDRRFEQ